MTNKISIIFVYALIFIISFYVNYYYGFQGINPVDNFTNYNSGFNFLIDKYPFKDFWTATGPLLGFIQSIFFKVFGINWTSYVIHASFFNSIISLSLFWFLCNFGISLRLSFIYSILFSIIFYPPAGTPFVDHHSMIFTYLSFFLLVYSINDNKCNLFFLLPVLFLFGFFSKQTPIGYFFLIITPIIILNLRKISQLRSIFLGSLLSIFLFFIYIFLTQTNIIDIYHQYILTASEVGSYRFNNSSFSFYDIFYRYRFIYISLFFLLYLIFRYKNFEKYFKISKFQLIYLLVALNCTLIFHQLLSMNQAFILSLIFLNFGMCFRFISFDKSKLLNNKIFFLIIIVSILVCTRYHFKYNEPRRFNDLAYSNKTQKINAGKYFPSLNKLHWFTRHSNDPKEEIKNLKLVYNILEKEKKIYSLVTDYQFLPSELKKYGNFPIKWFHPDVSFPVMPPQKNKWWNTLGSSMREQTAFKNFFVNQLRVNKVEKMYFIPPDGIRKEIIKVTIENDCRMDDLSLVKDQYEEISINCM